MDCGVRPTWPMTATPASTSARAARTLAGDPPSSCGGGVEVAGRGVASKGVRSGVERCRRVERSMKAARGDGRRETPGKVLKKRRSPRERGRMGTSVIRTERAFTASMPPSFMILVAVSIACAGSRSYDPNGRSPMRSGRDAPRATARKCDSISSSVIGSVVSCPWTTIAAESPTRQTSTPARSTCAQRRRRRRRGAGFEGFGGV